MVVSVNNQVKRLAISLGFEEQIKAMEECFQSVRNLVGKLEKAIPENLVQEGFAHTFRFLSAAEDVLTSFMKLYTNYIIDGAALQWFAQRMQPKLNSVLDTLVSWSWPLIFLCLWSFLLSLIDHAVREIQVISCLLVCLFVCCCHFILLCFVSFCFLVCLLTRPQTG